MEDPIVEEIHRTREKLLAECGGDLEKLMDRLQAREAEDAHRIVSSVREHRDERSAAGRGEGRRSPGRRQGRSRS